jgi:predicted Zn-dependent peptidase
MASTVIRKLSTGKSVLKNGATLLHTPLSTAPRLAFSLFVRGGSLLDPTPGMAEMVDRLLLKGTTSRTQEQISIEIDGLTLELDTDTRRDYLALRATLLEEDLDAAFALMADVFYNATFVELEREKQKVMGEVTMDLDSPKNRAADQFIRRVFQETAYGTVGSVILEQLPHLGDEARLKAHYQSVFTPESLVVSVAGPIAAEKAARLLETYFPASGREAVRPSAEREASVRDLRVTEETTVTFARDDSSQAHIYKGWLLPGVRHPDYAALALLNTILGGSGLTSRLFLELRDKQGLAYHVRSTYESYCHKGLFYLYIGTEPKNREKCLAGFVQEIDKLVNVPVSAQELEDAKRNMLGRRSVFLETAPQQANYIGSNFMLGRTLAEIENIPEQIEAVTSADIQRVAQTYLTQPAVISVVAPSRS